MNIFIYNFEAATKKFNIEGDILVYIVKFINKAKKKVTEEFFSAMFFEYLIGAGRTAHRI